MYSASRKRNNETVRTFVLYLRNVNTSGIFLNYGGVFVFLKWFLTFICIQLFSANAGRVRKRPVQPKVCLFSRNHSFCLIFKLMWVDRSNSWGQANIVRPSCSLSISKWMLAFQKTSSPRQNDMSELWPHMVHHVKVTCIAAWRAWRATKMKDHVEGNGSCNLTLWYRLLQNTIYSWRKTV